LSLHSIPKVPFMLFAVVHMLCLWYAIHWLDRIRALLKGIIILAFSPFCKSESLNPKFGTRRLICLSFTKWDFAREAHKSQLEERKVAQWKVAKQYIRHMLVCSQWLSLKHKFAAENGVISRGKKLGDLVAPRSIGTEKLCSFVALEGWISGKE
jgi:hypothetical protein